MKIDTSEVDLAIRNLQAELTSPSRLSTFFAQVAKFVDIDVKSHFKREAGPSALGKVISQGTKRWTGLTERAKQKKAKKGTLGKGILVDSGDLKSSLSKFSSGQSGGLQTTVTYARDHQFGKNGMIARPYLWFSTKVVNKIMNLLSKNIIKAWDV